MKVHEFERLVHKLALAVRNSRDRLAWFEHDGKVITRTKRSHGKGDLPEHLIRQQLKLNQNELAGILRCSLYRDDYVEILKKKGQIVDDNPANNKNESPEIPQSQKAPSDHPHRNQEHHHHRGSQYGVQAD